MVPRRLASIGIDSHLFCGRECVDSRSQNVCVDLSRFALWSDLCIYRFLVTALCGGVTSAAATVAAAVAAVAAPLSSTQEPPCTCRGRRACRRRLVPRWNYFIGAFFFVLCAGLARVRIAAV